MTDLSRLEELARKATEGPWEQHPLRTMSVQQPVFSCWIPAEAADAAYIAACDPQTVLALVERLRAAEERVAKPLAIGWYLHLPATEDDPEDYELFDHEVTGGKRVAIVEVE